VMAVFETIYWKITGKEAAWANTGALGGNSIMELPNLLVFLAMFFGMMWDTVRYWVSRQLTDNDLKPESVIFIVEVFNALYVSNALHNSSSWKTTATIMAIDFTHFWLSMLDVVEALDEVKVLIDKIPQGHPIAKENFVHVAMRLVETEYMLKYPIKCSSTGASKVAWAAEMEAWVSSKSVPSKGSSSRQDLSLVKKIKGGRLPGKLLISSARARVFPVRPPQRRPRVETKTGLSPDADPNIIVNPSASLGLETIFSRQERAQFIRQSDRVLFITEYIVLIEYAEVVLPIIYSLHEMVLFNMPNRAYSPALAEMSTANLLSSVLNVLVYSSLEFLSLIMAIVVLKRKVGFSTLRQLAFVLETQASMVQSKLTTLFVYVMQVPLVHLGAASASNSLGSIEIPNLKLKL
ncbi:hypothetical protein PF011_g15524, partial [Phytophthora fragariae]